MKPTLGRPMPPKYKHVMHLDFLRQLNLKDRIRILFGYSLKVRLKIYAEHSTAKFEPIMDIELTKELPKEPALPTVLSR